ncbi:aminopeptidase [Burkholderia lata]|uniref:suppressor of fused domain protein n=1 Tax=Burkholderia lata (strain ATCC 17760 / DSM 23089 / LMG 22485 / NCIMB 9086 / R18194 / 383) TaxID=482957 RepID=UPI0014545B8E|nr:suppressor of fused domain protein [Burkholderia lata]VWD54570.1 aminopeptidase [Burkholderia lata]
MTDASHDTQDGAADDGAPGWDAIDGALARVYPGQEPKHYGTLIKWRLGGPDPLDGISVWKRAEPVPHWHFVTYGLSELYAKESDDPAVSGFGFELTMRVACGATDEEPPNWVFSFLQNLARYVFESGNAFGDGHWMSANGPIALETDTKLCSMGFVFDPELPTIDTPHGHLAFLQVVGLTLDEERAAKRWRTRALLDVLLPHLPLWISDLGRASLLERADVRAQVDEGTRRDGSSSGSLFTDVLAWETRKRLLRAPLVEITVGARQVDELVALLPLRLPFDRPLRLVGCDTALRFERGDANAVADEDGRLTLRLTDATVQALARTLQPRAGEYAVDGLDGVRWRVEKTVIRDAQGNAVQTIG